MKGEVLETIRATASRAASGGYRHTIADSRKKQLKVVLPFRETSSPSHHNNNNNNNPAP